MADKKNVAHLHDGEALVSQLIENLPLAIAVVDNDMRYILANREWIGQYGIKENNIIGKSHYEIFPEIGDDWKAVHKRCLAGAIESRLEDPFPRADGGTDYVNWEVRPWYDESGKIGGMIMYTAVVTKKVLEEKELKEKTEELEKMNKVMVGRELKMAELKGENERLRNELAQKK